MSSTGVAHVTSGNVLQVDMNSQRSTLDILWSCLATTFAVTWLSVHPNIPAFDEKQWRVTWNRFKIMFWALIAPEFIVLWAWRQRRGARKIAEEVRKLSKRTNQKYGHDWTITHGHFFQMGGFAIQYGDESPQVLYFKNFKSLVGETIDIPSISEKEINDRGKSDPLGKGIATLQILWFITQVIARQVYHLAITQLELTTAALACLNATMYILWWNKPSDVRCPVIIRSRRALLSRLLDQPVQSPKAVIFWSRPSYHEAQTDDGSWVTTSTLQTPEPVVFRDPPSYHEVQIPKSDDELWMMKGALQTPEPIFILDTPSHHEVQIQESNDGQRMTTGTLSTASWKFPQRWKPQGSLCSLVKPFLNFTRPIVPFVRLVNGIVDDLGSDRETRPPVFYVWTEYESLRGRSYEPTATWKELLPTSLVGCFFGGVHILGWNLEFPSFAEKTIWKISACTITVIPCLYMSFPLMLAWIIQGHRELECWEIRRSMGIVTIYSYTTTFVSYCVVIARTFLLIESLLALGALPPSAFATVNWLAVIPHI